MASQLRPSRPPSINSRVSTNNGRGLTPDSRAPTRRSFDTPGSVTTSLVSSPKTTPRTTPTHSVTTPSISSMISGQSRFSKSRGRLQCRSNSVPSIPLLEDGAQATAEREMNKVEESPVATSRENAKPEPSSIDVERQGPPPVIRQELLMLCDDSFSIARDSYHHCLFSIVGLLLLFITTYCLFLATIPDQSDPNVQTKRFIYFSGALIAVLLTMAVCLRFGLPSSIRIMRLNGAWAISLHRRGLPPIIKTLLELEAFVETFGYCGKSPVRFKGRRVGLTTSNDGTMHLFFYRSLSSSPLCMSVCLQDPLAFLTKLRDVMTVTAHPLVGITTDYVADWDAATDDASLTGTNTNTSATEPSQYSFSIGTQGTHT